MAARCDANTRFVDFWRESQSAPGYAKVKQPSCLAKFDNRMLGHPSIDNKAMVSNTEMQVSSPHESAREFDQPLMPKRRLLAAFSFFTLILRRAIP
jgi:hypothetical protein